MISVEKNKAFITSFIVLIFVFLSFILTGPIISRMSKKIEAYKDALVFALEKELSIIISYEKMSPSVLNSLKISNITVFDTKTIVLWYRFRQFVCIFSPFFNARRF